MSTVCRQQSAEFLQHRDTIGRAVDVGHAVRDPLQDFQYGVEADIRRTHCTSGMQVNDQ